MSNGRAFFLGITCLAGLAGVVDYLSKQAAIKERKIQSLNEIKGALSEVQGMVRGVRANASALGHGIEINVSNTREALKKLKGLESDWRTKQQRLSQLQLSLHAEKSRMESRLKDQEAIISSARTRTNYLRAEIEKARIEGLTNPDLDTEITLLEGKIDGGEKALQDIRIRISQLDSLDTEVEELGSTLKDALVSAAPAKLKMNQNKSAAKERRVQVNSKLKELDAWDNEIQALIHDLDRQIRRE